MPLGALGGPETVLFTIYERVNPLDWFILYSLPEKKQMVRRKTANELCGLGWPERMRAALILLLSAKMCTFIHSYLRYVVNKKVTIRAEYQARYSALLFGKKK